MMAALAQMGYGGPTMGDVQVRIGEHRYAYHTDPACPALNGKPETFRGKEQISSEEAEQRGLTACKQCKR